MCREPGPWIYIYTVQIYDIYPKELRQHYGIKENTDMGKSYNFCPVPLVKKW